MVENVSRQDELTLINVFVVEPGKQDELIELLTGATENFMSKQPGYLSARIHRSLDGGRVAVYAKWRSVKDFRALSANAEAVVHMARARALASFEPVLYEVVYTHQAAARQPA